MLVREALLHTAYILGNANIFKACTVTFFPKFKFLNFLLMKDHTGLFYSGIKSFYFLRL